jgi:hypothetical protein
MKLLIIKKGMFIQTVEILNQSISFRKAVFVARHCIGLRGFEDANAARLFGGRIFSQYYTIYPEYQIR